MVRVLEEEDDRVVPRVFLEVVVRECVEDEEEEEDDEEDDEGGGGDD